jgi:acetoin utilization protein AcuB
MKIGAIMSTRLVTVHMDDTLEAIQEIFTTGHIHHVLVVDEGELYGIISDRDLLRALSPYIGSNVETLRDVATLNKRAHQIMTRRPVTLSREADSADAVRLLLGGNFSCLPVVDERQRPVGIVTWRDLLKHLLA